MGPMNVRSPRGDFPEVIDLLLRSQHRVEHYVWELTEEVKRLMATVAEARASVEKLDGKVDELIALAKEIKAGQAPNQEDVDAIFNGAEAESVKADEAMAELRS